ncbi:MAG: 16S rRNA (guanine(527)-N(7))-methyltransferase RsmG [Anaerolineaceae bacterium]|nr:16S rRNA (guanine(527)-N(7))-methyltransferase RsmG [Anaerolineaceae bacterium]
MENWIKSAEQLFGVSLSDDQQERFQVYENLLLEWNAKINLTAVRDVEGIRIKHFLDSLSCVPVLGDMNGKALIDIGTGAGFPGIPLRIFYPEMDLTLVDSVGKKADFCRLVCDTLHLKGVTVLKDRSEELGVNKAAREKFDAATARAVAVMPVLCEYLLPLVKVGGVMLAQKGESAPEEVKTAENAVSKLGGGEPSLTEVNLPGVEGSRYLVKVPKICGTPSGYPRRTGLPLKKPIL